jgi:hypothetical protein
MRFQKFLGLSVVAAAVIGAACSDRVPAEPETPAQPPAEAASRTSGWIKAVGPGRAVASAARKSLEARTATFVVEGELTFDGDRSPMRGWGSLDFDSERSSVTFLSDGETTEVIVDGRQVYTRYEGDELWSKEDSSYYETLPLFDRMDPTEVLEHLTEIGETVTDEGWEDWRGKQAHHYRVEIDYLEAFMVDDRELLADWFEEEPEFSVDAWIGDDGLPLRISYMLQMETSLGGDDDLAFAFEISLAYDFADWGKPVRIEIPDPSQVEDDFGLTDLADIPESTWPSSVPCGSGAMLDACLKATPALLSGSDCSEPGLRICLQPVGAVPEAQISALVEHFRTTYAVRIDVLPAIDMPAAAMAERTTQASTFQLLTAVADRYPHLDPDLEASFLVITPVDVWQESRPEWGWVFGQATVDSQDSVHYRWAALSTFRMNPVTYGEAANPQKWEKRIRTLMTKYVGLTYFHYPLSDDPRSPMFRSITGLSILDGITLPLPPLETAPRR